MLLITYTTSHNFHVSFILKLVTSVLIMSFPKIKHHPHYRVKNNICFYLLLYATPLQNLHIGFQSFFHKNNSFVYIFFSITTE